MARRKRRFLLDDPPSDSSSHEQLEESSLHPEEETPAKTQPDPDIGGERLKPLIDKRDRARKMPANRRLGYEEEDSPRRSKRKKRTSDEQLEELSLHAEEETPAKTQSDPENGGERLKPVIDKRVRFRKMPANRRLHDGEESSSSRSNRKKSTSDEQFEESSLRPGEENLAKTQPDPENGDDLLKPAIEKRDRKMAANPRLGDGKESSSRQSNRKTSTSDAPKVLSRKVWSEGDEIAILKGLLSFSASNNDWNGSRDTEAISDFVKKSFQLEEDFTTTQLRGKIRKLKMKCEKHLAVEGFHSADPHEMKVFELSKELWGHELKPTKTSKPEPESIKTSKPEATKRSEPDPKKALEDAWDVLGKLLKRSQVPSSLLKDGFALIPEGQKADIMARCERILLSQLEIDVEKNSLMSNLNQVVLEALKSVK